MPQDSKHIVSERLKSAGLRVTPQRRAVLGAFRGGESGHLTADEVFEVARRELPELARATVYNSLAELVRVGLLRTVEGLGAVRYDPNLDPEHHHFRCLNCGRLYDVRPEGMEGLRLPDAGFGVKRTVVLFEGICGRCSERNL
ncbi:transcriptional repressor [Rubrobacter taiwanensis]|jgi:Fe2+ or Zn2+ uptake regulation protein|uniref:Transcriptional repressor n=1 Tax=Rubrobacter taiwanensis TaxID=185139 RepID=A0A4R1BE32_9ACTN|nr:transcriptional repressor [Rubrobacter taiwanensis]TCJ15317.1 transcriptional repressor [Rubrobacter taiwanensis]